MMTNINWMAFDLQRLERSVIRVGLTLQYYYPGCSSGRAPGKTTRHSLAKAFNICDGPAHLHANHVVVNL